MINLFEDFPDRLGFVLIKLGWERNDFYNKSGIPLRLLDSWLSGDNKPSVYDIYRVCKITGASTDYFFGLTEAPNVATPNRYVSVFGLDDDQLQKSRNRFLITNGKTCLRNLISQQQKKSRQMAAHNFMEVL